jgi:hypothetical protein
VEINFHFIRERERVTRKLLDIQFISSQDQVVDIFTKPLVECQFRIYRDNLNLVARG